MLGLQRVRPIPSHSWDSSSLVLVNAPELDFQHLGTILYHITASGHSLVYTVLSLSVRKEQDAGVLHEKIYWDGLEDGGESHVYSGSRMREDY